MPRAVFVNLNEKTFRHPGRLTLDTGNVASAAWCTGNVAAAGIGTFPAKDYGIRASCGLSLVRMSSCLQRSIFAFASALFRLTHSKRIRPGGHFSAVPGAGA